VELPPVAPLTCQITLALPLLATVAVNACVPPVWTVAVAGETLTVIGGAGELDPDPPQAARLISAAELSAASRRHRKTMANFSTRLPLIPLRTAPDLIEP
jgi:hypothetical protein